MTEGNGERSRTMTFSEQLRVLRAQLDDAAKKGDDAQIRSTIHEISVLVSKIFVQTQKMAPEWAEIKTCYGCYIN